MRYLIAFCLLSCFLIACSGNPPAWWNPNNRYGTAESQAVTPTPKKTPAAQEETIEMLKDTSYEEETISPLPEEEEPAASSASAPLTVEPEGLLTPSVLE